MSTTALLLQWLIFYGFIAIVVIFGAYLIYEINERRNYFSFLTPRIMSFGIDGAQIARTMIIRCVVCMITSLGLNLFQESVSDKSHLLNIICLLFQFVLCYQFYTNGKYTYNLYYGSLVSKFYGSEQLIKSLLNKFEETQLKNNDSNKSENKKRVIRTLDAGCGSGMITTIFSKLFFNKFNNTFKGLSASGADKWISIEQSNSSESSIMNNLKLEGLVDNKQFSFNVETCDLRDMPFKDGTFDMVMTSLVMHIINQRQFDSESKLERKKAVESLIRVLSPNGGILAIWDIIHTHEYLEVIKSHKCMTNISYIPVTCSYTEYPSDYMIIAVKQGTD